MKMKLLSIVMFLFLGINVVFGQVDFGIKAGVNFANVNVKNALIDVETVTRPSFHIGPVVAIGVADAIKINTGLLFVGRGYKTSLIFLNETIEASTSLMYLQVPLNVVYDADMFYFSAGPYVGFGVAGKMKIGDEEEKISFGNTTMDDVGPLDMGLNFELGTQFDSFRLGVGYDLGLVNTRPKDAIVDDESVKNIALTLSGVYFFR